MLQWLQVFGRFHLLVLHLPIGLLAGLAAVEFITLIRRRPPAREVTGLLVWCVGVFAALAAAMGYVLSLEGNHGGDVLTQHLYLGIAFAAVCLLTAILHARKRRILFRSSLALAIIILIPTGHLGGTLTHGADFLTSPLQPARAPIPTRTSEPTSSAATFATAIAPILQSRCGDCHGQSRARGGLALHTPEAIITGGKHGAVILPADPASSEILRRHRFGGRRLHHDHPHRP
nr:hypothetical protein [Phycisphaerales bacterium]